MKKAQLLGEEAELWDRFRTGDEEAFSQIFAAFSDILYKYGCRLHADKELVKDCLQDLFVTIWNRRHRLGPTTSIKFYLFRALRREIAVKVKQAAKLSVYGEAPESAKMVASSDHALIEAEDENQLYLLLEKAVEQLSERQKEAVYLRFYHNMEFSEIASLLGITQRAVYKLIYRAIDLLQKSFQRSAQVATYPSFVFNNYHQQLEFGDQELQFGMMVQVILASGTTFFLS